MKDAWEDGLCRFLPGRLRITVQGLRRNHSFADQLTAGLEKLNGVMHGMLHPIS